MYTENTIKVNGNDISYWKVENTVNGNPRYIIHFLDLLTDKDNTNDKSISEKYNIALNKSRILSGKKYRAKWFGGGIVISSYSLQSDLEFMLNNN